MAPVGSTEGYRFGPFELQLDQRPLPKACEGHGDRDTNVTAGVDQVNWRTPGLSPRLSTL
jgi:hypothetical protein